MNKENASYDRRVITLALAILKRAKSAGIPERYLRIDKDTFSSYLSPLHYDAKHKSELCDFIYDRANDFSSIPNVLIDGGNILSRKMAGFALLFRTIACDKVGLYKECVDLQHKFQTIKSTEDQNRNDLAEELKYYDVLFLAEFHPSYFAVHFDSGSFFDEILSYRFDNNKQTIISFQDPIGAGTIKDRVCGRYLAEFSNKEFDKNVSYSKDLNSMIVKVKVL